MEEEEDEESSPQLKDNKQTWGYRKAETKQGRKSSLGTGCMCVV